MKLKQAIVALGLLGVLTSAPVFAADTQGSADSKSMSEQQQKEPAKNTHHKRAHHRTHKKQKHSVKNESKSGQTNHAPEDSSNSQMSG